jgi:hypothetical protein
MKRLIVTIMLLAVSGFESSANEQNQKLLALSEEDRNAAFIDVVRKAGECDRVVRTMLMGSNPKGDVSWSVGCANQSSYHVNVPIEPQFKLFALTCEDFKAFGSLAIAVTRPEERRLQRPPECWQKF